MSKIAINKFESLQVYGINNAFHLIQVKKIRINFIDLMIDGLACKKSWVKKIINEGHIKVNRLNKDQFIKKYLNKRTQGIVINFERKKNINIPSFKNKNNICILALDNIEDPQNLGQIIRTAECAGIDGILIPNHRSVQITSSVVQVSQGAFIHMPIYNCNNMHQQLLFMKSEGFWVVGVENSINVMAWDNLDYSRNLIIVVGSEGKGIRPIILKTCDDLITIPMQGSINSLNVSAAVSAILFERQRQLLKI